MAQPWTWPIGAIVSDHAQALTGLIDTVREVSELPVKTGLRILTGDARQRPSAQRIAETTIQELHTELQEIQQAFQALLQRYQQAHEDHQIELARWQIENERLRAETALVLQQHLDDQKRQFLAWVEPTFLQIPLVAHALQAGQQISAQDVIFLFKPFESALAAWGVDFIGKTGQTLSYNPMHHDTAGVPLQEGTAVAVRQPGYRLQETVIRRAQVIPVVEGT
ncbi:MAG: nucleotide exchange factor GrpE [Candidatus Sericytochromatia bacterium]|nr:nucleotide exchange factor GrpE [Candidatus Sericytochromatia bacterium]